MTRRKKKEKQRHHNDANTHVFKRLKERYPQLDNISIKDLKEAPFLRLFPTRDNGRIVTAILLNDALIYIVYTVANKMVHTVLTEEQVQATIDKRSLNIVLDRKCLIGGILSKYKTYDRWIEVCEKGE